MSDGKWDEVAQIASDPEAVEALPRMINSMDEAIRKDGVRAFGIVVIQGDGVSATAYYSGDEHDRLTGALGGLIFDLRLSVRSDG